MALPPKPTLTPAPPAPVRGEAPATFTTKSNAFVAWQANQLRPQVQGALDWVDLAANEVASDAASAAASELNAANSSAAAVGAANYKGNWASLTGPISIPASVAHNGSVWLLLQNLANVAASEPGVSNDWQNLEPSAFLVGDILVSNRALSAPQWLPADGSVYLQSAYPELFAQVGLLPNQLAEVWTPRTSGFGTTTINGVTFGNGLFVAVGGSGTLRTSPDGITWTTRTSGFGTNTITGVTFGNGLFVAVGGNGTLTTSPDGITWTTRTSGFGTTTIRGVTFGNGLFVAVGDSGTLRTSPDGINWTTRTSGFGSSVIFGVTFGNGLFVAVGDSGNLRTSPDGITWTARTSGFGTTTILGVTFGNGLFVAVGDSGNLRTSPDGITWTARTSGFGTTTILGVTFGNGLFVAVGQSGTLATSLLVNYNQSTQFVTPNFSQTLESFGSRAFIRAIP